MRFSTQDYWSGLPFPSLGIFPTEGSTPGLLRHGQVLYHLSHQGGPLPLQVPHNSLPFTALVSLLLLKLSGHTPAFGPLPLFTSAWNVLLGIHSQALIHPLTFPSSTVTSSERLFSTTFPKTSTQLKESACRTSLVVQWLRLCTPNAGNLSSIPGQGARSYMLQLNKDLGCLN